MNSWQTAMQIRHLLRTVEWADGSTGVVFGDRGAYVYAGSPQAARHPPTFPFAQVMIEGGTADPDHPQFIEQTFSVVVAVNVKGDNLGQQAIIGGPAPDLGDSQGRGVAEVVERALAGVGELTGADGAWANVSLSAVTAPTLLAPQLAHVALQQFNITAMVTRAPYWAPPEELAYNHGTTYFTWEGSHCINRYDFLQFRLVENAVTLYTGSAELYNGLGNNSATATIVADYDPRGTGSAAYTSTIGTGSTITVSTS